MYNLKTLGVSSFDISKSDIVDNMFCDCNKLTDVDKKSFGRTSFKCRDCDSTNPFLNEYTNDCVQNCGKNDDYKYLIEEEKICVKNCNDNEDYKYLIEEENKCVKNCEDTEYKYLIEEENKCVKNESNFIKYNLLFIFIFLFF